MCKSKQGELFVLSIDFSSRVTMPYQIGCDVLAQLRVSKQSLIRNPWHVLLERRFGRVLLHVASFMFLMSRAVRPMKQMAPYSTASQEEDWKTGGVC